MYVCVKAFLFRSKPITSADPAMSDHSESPEVDEAALDAPEDKLSAELALEEEDASLLDAGLGDTGTEEGEGDGNAGALLEESNDSVNIEDPVRYLRAAPAGV